MKAWLVLPEAPNDDDEPTGRYFATLHNVIDFDHFGEPILGDQVSESHLFNSEIEAERFVEQSGELKRNVVIP